MKRITYFTSGILALTPFISIAQNQTDALRYSQVILGGTARFMGMAGAYTAVGGDASALGYNPAGLAVFNKSQFTFSPGFTLNSSSSTYNGVTLTGQKPVATIENIGWIASWKNTRNEAMWKSIDFGIAYNRNNNFNANIDIQGSSTTSLLDQFVSSSDGYYPGALDAYSTSQAYYSGLTYNKKGDSGTYYNIVDPYLVTGHTMLQQKSIERSGSMGETDLSFAANYNNKLYLGATLGITSVRYNENATYSETPQYTDTVYGLQQFSYQTTLKTRGGGFNMKFGFIYRITDWLRIGGAVHTPTWFSLTDNYSSFISAQYGPTNYYATSGTWGGTPDGNPVTGSYNYTIVTPMRAMGGIAFVIRHKALISADYEYVNYSKASLSSADAGAFNTANAAIKQFYMPASNLRIGAEWVLYPFSIRAGYAFYGDPYSSSAGNSSIRNMFTAGFGVKINRWFVDLAYVFSQYKENYYLYDPSLANVTDIKTTASDVVMTFGVNF